MSNVRSEQMVLTLTATVCTYGPLTISQLKLEHAKKNQENEKIRCWKWLNIKKITLILE